MNRAPGESVAQPPERMLGTRPHLGLGPLLLLPADIQRQMKLWRLGLVGMPRAYIDWHRERAEEALRALCALYPGLRPVDQTMRDGGLPEGEGAVRRVSVSDLLADFDKTPGEAAALYVQTKVRAELQAQAKLSAAVASLASAREWFAAWHESERKVW